MVLADTSIWIDHLRNGNEELSRLLDEGLVLCHPFIIGELACGNLTNRTEITSLLAALPQASVASHDEVLAFIDARGLAGQGLGYVDMHLLSSAVMTGVPLWTQDRRLNQVAARLRSAYEAR